MANCHSCKSEISPGARWCDICHTNTVNPEFGRLASPGKRLAAYFFDAALPVVFFFTSVLAAGASASVADDAETGGGIGGVVLLLLLLGYMVWALMLFTNGTTPGKRLLGMWVIKESGQRASFLTMLIRETIGKVISGMLLSLGYIWILIDKGNQGWHDKLMSTFVVENRK